MMAMIPPGPFAAPLAIAKTTPIKMIARHPRQYLRGGESARYPIEFIYPRSVWKVNSRRFAKKYSYLAHMRDAPTLIEEYDVIVTWSTDHRVRA